MVRATTRRVFLLIGVSVATPWFAAAETSLAPELRILPNGASGPFQTIANGSPQKPGGRWDEIPAWQLDLPSLRHEYAPSRTKGPHNRGPAESIRFTSDNVLVVTFLTADVPVEARDRAGRNLAWPWRLHALFVDGATGQIRNTREWSIPSGNGSIIPVTGGKFVLFAPDHLVLYSPELQPLKEMPLPPASLEKESGPQVRHSPSGKSVLLVYRADDSTHEGGYTDRGQYDFVWIDSENLAVVRAWREEGWENTWRGPELINTLGGYVGRISDSEMVRSLGGAIILRKFDEPWRLVLVCHQPAYCGDAQFVDNQTLLMYLPQTCPWRIDIEADFRADGGSEKPPIAGMHTATRSNRRTRR